jgi:uncharacterized protein YdeI (YjbR/CyaY-like superfamily)
LEANDASNKERKKLYGKSSEHRPKDEFGGVEYRVLSNYCLRSPRLVDLAYDLTMLAMRAEIENKGEEIIQSVDENEVISAINTGSKAKAKKILKQLPIPEGLKQKIADFEKQKFSPMLEEAWGIK